ncbi:hypothetical protein J5N97_019656 [Dioscorea zingiberensis]|uniref:Uncharacterized protein n=1 Tax=Dioscorea zingiberensis TaxID=325984 RepID=A0A9D5CFG0_9LILI|nr:hypothetical protein J5N97_019656 [Dioscorea zingiberensis]
MKVRKERSKNAGDAWRRRSPSDEPTDMVECSGKSCRACTAFILADCIAVSCCPCAVVSLLTMAFFKVPLMFGRRFLSSLRKKGSKNVIIEEKGGGDEVVNDVVVSKTTLAEGEVNACINGHLFAGLEAERVWLEIYQVGNWGFGRVSFSGVKGEMI